MTMRGCSTCDVEKGVIRVVGRGRAGLLVLVAFPEGRVGHLHRPWRLLLRAAGGRATSHGLHGRGDRAREQRLL